MRVLRLYGVSCSHYLVYSAAGAVVNFIMIAFIKLLVTIYVADIKRKQYKCKVNICTVYLYTVIISMSETRDNCCFFAVFFLFVYNKLLILNKNNYEEAVDHGNT